MPCTYCIAGVALCIVVAQLKRTADQRLCPRDLGAGAHGRVAGQHMPSVNAMIRRSVSRGAVRLGHQVHRLALLLQSYLVPKRLHFGWAAGSALPSGGARAPLAAPSPTSQPCTCSSARRRPRSTQCGSLCRGGSKWFIFYLRGF